MEEENNDYDKVMEQVRGNRPATLEQTLNLFNSAGITLSEFLGYVTDHYCSLIFQLRKLKLQQHILRVTEEWRDFLKEHITESGLEADESLVHVNLQKQEMGFGLLWHHRYAEAEMLFREAIMWWRNNIETIHPGYLGLSLGGLAYALEGLGRNEEAALAEKESVILIEKHGGYLIGGMGPRP